MTNPFCAIGGARAHQGQVNQAARERTREYLRAGQDFVWNATYVSHQLRERSIALLREYNAEIEIVYVEVSPETLFKQNRERRDAIPETSKAGLSTYTEIAL